MNTLIKSHRQTGWHKQALTSTSTASFFWNSWMDRLSGGVLKIFKKNAKTISLLIRTFQNIYIWKCRHSKFVPFGKKKVFKGIGQLWPHSVKLSRRGMLTRHRQSNRQNLEQRRNGKLPGALWWTGILQTQGHSQGLQERGRQGGDREETAIAIDHETETQQDFKVRITKTNCRTAKAICCFFHTEM